MNKNRFSIFFCILLNTNLFYKDSIFSEPSKIIYAKAYTQTELFLKKEPNTSSTTLNTIKDSEIGLLLNKELFSNNGIDFYYVKFGNSTGYIDSANILLSYSKELLDDSNYIESESAIPYLYILPTTTRENEYTSNQLKSGNISSYRWRYSHHKNLILNDNVTMLLYKLKHESIIEYNILFDYKKDKKLFKTNLDNIRPYDYAINFPLITGSSTQCHDCSGEDLAYLFLLGRGKVFRIPHWEIGNKEECANSHEPLYLNEMRLSNDNKTLYIKNSYYQCEEVDEENCLYYETCKNDPPIFFQAKHIKTYYLRVQTNSNDFIFDGTIYRGNENIIDFDTVFSETKTILFESFQL
ncbi:hypothetical protein [Leptospira bourretii]|uniref:SH3 domain-containing protein n=1 Tax=Leptospira bourretii TaxID=2484962 RepID=A0ABY2LFJ4_9LEPT|nr:hypothetical protein [Leptospira bourretii]TGK92229.1 hypothetical protein EHQ26_09640 [Leptospira bourretii]TGL26318.1 hypothetical protein EHQ45_20145 [Leptospira bourretii]